jgi:hypothetical protein
LPYFLFGTSSTLDLSKISLLDRPFFAMYEGGGEGHRNAERRNGGTPILRNYGTAVGIADCGIWQNERTGRNLEEGGRGKGGSRSRKNVEGRKS